MRVWTEAVKRAIVRHVAQTGSPIFTRQAFFAAEEAALTAETKTMGLTPRQTATREFQYLRDAGLLEFLRSGTYRWLGEVPASEPAIPSAAVFVLGARADRTVLPEVGFAFASEWLPIALRAQDQWVLYQGSGGYGAAARAGLISADAKRPGVAHAQIEPGSYVEFGRTVPLVVDGRIMELGLSGPDGVLDARLAAQAIRAITAEDFDRILNLGLITEDEVLPRDGDVAEPINSPFRDERNAFEGPVDRLKMLVERTVRDKQFRKRVLEIYGARCALTGMNLINGRGRAETQAAHIKSVADGGPDSIRNGIALSGTVHWMFDRGLISLTDAGDILLSRAINDRDGVERLIYPDRKARLPANPAHRPHPAYLHWHRTKCFHD